MYRVACLLIFPREAIFGDALASLGTSHGAGSARREKILYEEIPMGQYDLFRLIWDSKLP